MKRLLCFLMVLSAMGLLAFYEGAVPAPDGTDVVMGRFSITFGIASVFTMILVRKHEMVTVAALLSALFWFSIHPNLPGNASAVFIVIAILAVAVLAASVLDDSYGNLTWAYPRMVVAAALGLGGSILGQHVAYQSNPGEPLWTGVAVEGVIFLLAFTAAPWRPADLAWFSPRAAMTRLIGES